MTERPPPKKPEPRSRTPGRADRLAAALRANLARRKARGKVRAAGADPGKDRG